MFLRGNGSRRRMQEAELARRNRLEIVKAWSQGKISRRSAA